MTPLKLKANTFNGLSISKIYQFKKNLEIFYQHNYCCDNLKNKNIKCFNKQHYLNCYVRNKLKFIINTIIVV